MRFKISRGSAVIRAAIDPPCKEAVRDGKDWCIELNSLEELLTFCSDIGTDLVLSDDRSIIIYDAYLE